MVATLYNEDVAKKIRTLYLQGKIYKEIQAELNINPATWDSWYYNDTNGFRQFMLNCQLEKMRIIARNNIEEIASMDLSDKDDVRYLKIKADMNAFIAETVDKDNFSKKIAENNDKQTLNISINEFKKIPERIEKLKEAQKP